MGGEEFFGKTNLAPEIVEKKYGSEIVKDLHYCVVETKSLAQ